MSLRRTAASFRSISRSVTAYVVLCAVSVTAQAAAQDSALPAPHSLETIVSAAAAAYLDNPGTASLSIGVSYQGENQTFHFGRISKAASVPPTDSTIFAIASITKTFTGALLARAELDGKLDTKDPVSKFMDGSYPNLQFQQPIRLFHLLNHRSGLPFILPNPPEANPQFDSPIPFPVRVNNIVANSSREDFYRSLHGVELKAVPGAQFEYSNAGGQLAGYVVERVYGQDYESLLRRFITAPLGMPDTVIELTPAQAARLAPGHEKDGTILAPETSKFEGAGAIKSTVKDLLAYAQWQLDESDPVVALSHKPTYTNANFSIGLNWQILREGERRVIWQDGAIPGYASFCILQPDSKLAIVILSNELDDQTLNRLSEMANRIMKAVAHLSVTKP